MILIVNFKPFIDKQLQTLNRYGKKLLMRKSKMKKYALIMLALSMTILFSCYVAPKPVFRLKPAAENQVWLLGKEYVTSCNDSVEIALAFDRVMGTNYVFKVEIINKTRRNMLIQPEKCFYVAEIAQVNGVRTDTVWAIDPESEILKIDKQMSRTFASYKSTQGTYSFLSVLDLVSDVATIGSKKSDEEIKAEKLDDVEQELAELNNEIRHEQNITNLNNVRKEWEFFALRKTTLPGGYEIQGRIYFPTHQLAKSLVIHLAFDENKFTQKYHQTIEEVY